MVGIASAQLRTRGAYSVKRYALEIPIVRDGGASYTRTHRLSDRVRAEIRARHYSRRTEKSYLRWIRRFWLYPEERDPAGVGADAVRNFLCSLATEKGVAAKAYFIRQIPRDGIVLLRASKADKFGRYLAEVWVNGVPLNQKMIEEGFAVKVRKNMAGGRGV